MLIEIATSESQYLLSENRRGMKLNITEYCVKKREFSQAKKFVVFDYFHQSLCSWIFLILWKSAKLLSTKFKNCLSTKVRIWKEVFRYFILPWNDISTRNTCLLVLTFLFDNMSLHQSFCLIFGNFIIF